VTDFWVIFQIPNFKQKSELTDENTKTTGHRMHPVVLTHLLDFCPVYRPSGNTGRHAGYTTVRGEVKLFPRLCVSSKTAGHTARLRMTKKKNMAASSFGHCALEGTSAQ
jgi:hypothetical protein